MVFDDDMSEAVEKMQKEKSSVLTNGTVRKNKVERNSGIELLKILAIFLVVISHVTQTLTDLNTYVPFDDYILNLSHATTDLQQLILTMLRYSGILGNTLFFICSAWFMLDSNTNNKRKILQVLMDVWMISIGILVIVLILRGGQIDGKLFLRQLFPTTFGNNWYMTCYLLFCLLYPSLNFVLCNMNQKTLLRTCIILIVLYMGFNYIAEIFFFPSKLILWVTIYFAIAYMKRYLLHSVNRLKVNLILLLIGLLGNCGIICVTNFLGLRIEFFADQLLHWNRNCSPFILLTAIALFNIFRNMYFQSTLINSISGFSFLIYIIHENQLLRTYYRPLLWNFIYETYGYEHLLLWTLVLVLIVFLFGFCCSLFYKLTFQRVTVSACNWCYPRITKAWNGIENILLKAR